MKRFPFIFASATLAHHVDIFIYTRAQRERAHQAHNPYYIHIYLDMGGKKINTFTNEDAS